MNVLVSPRPLAGTVAAPASKSEAHRLLICAALADRPTRIGLNAQSEDIEATIGCLRALGAVVEERDGALDVTPLDPKNIPARPLLDCRESGSTLRFMLPVAAALCGEGAAFTGAGRLPDRPIGALLDALGAHGVRFSSDHLPLKLHGRMEPGVYALPGNVSSQYVTGLLLALPLLDGGSEIRLTSPLQSAAYVDITLAALRKFGVPVRGTGEGFGVPGGLGLRSPGSVDTDGDWSSAAFFLTAGALAGPVTVTGLSLDSPQGDKRIVDYLRDFGASVTVGGDGGSSVTVAPGKGARGQSIDIDPTPDLLPVLGVAAACAEGRTEFRNGSRLRLKESDRLTSTAAIIRSLGGKVQELPDGLIVEGSPLSGRMVDGFHDHRVVMAAVVAAARCRGDLMVTGVEAVNKSYPAFFRDFAALGGAIHVF